MFYHWILYGDGTTPVDVNCHQRGCTTERVKRNGSHLSFALCGIPRAQRNGRGVLILIRVSSPGRAPHLAIGTNEGVSTVVADGVPSDIQSMERARRQGRNRARTPARDVRSAVAA